MNMVARNSFSPDYVNPADRWTELFTRLEMAMVVRNKASQAHDEAENLYSEAVRDLQSAKPIEPKWPPLDLDLTLRQIMARQSCPIGERTYKEEMIEWRAKVGQVREQTVGNLEQEWESALLVTQDLLGEIAAHPVSSVQMLDHKLKALIADGGLDDFNQDWWPHIVRDVAQLAQPSDMDKIEEAYVR